MIKLKDILEVIKEDLPTKITDKAIKKSTVIVKSDPDDDSSDDFVAHHKYHSGPHIDGKAAEDDTYDFDDPNDDNEGGLQKDKDKAKRGYEPVREQTEIKKVVGVYGGRFQPFGPHHKKTYEWLEKQVDED